MISKLIVWGSNRTEAIRRMNRALLEYKITGIKTSIPFLQKIMDCPDFITGNYDTGFIENNAKSLFEVRLCNTLCQDVAIMTAYVDFVTKREKQTTPVVNNNNRSAWKQRKW
jgi:acetyl-CoA carboxylase biotin carboxylase subunit